MTTVSLVSQKGGVGKTTIAVNLSYSFARRGWRVLLVDADLQGGVGFSLTEKAKNAVGYFDFLTEEWICDEEEMEEAIIRTKLPGLSLLTRGSRDALDKMIEDQDSRWSSYERISGLNSIFSNLGFDIVLYDTQTGVSPLVTGVCRASDYLLVPEQPCPLCLRSLPQILRMLAAIRNMDEDTEGPRLAGFVLSMTDPDDPSNLDDQREFRDLLPVELVLETVIPIHRDFREASRVGVPVAMLRERPSASALIFDQLAAEMEAKLNLYDDQEEPAGDRDDYARLVD